jgi:hypothetical protein
MAQNDGEDPPPLGHFIFTGSPGTGKTTVARVMSKILFDLDLSSRNHVEETSGLNMQGQYVGQTKDVVESLLDKAKGGVLFIDEAYTLGQGSFGSEACDSLVAAMTNPEYAGVVVVIAGYPKDIDDMLQSNAGLKSRFTHTITFPDWNPNDCVDYYCKKAQSNGFVLRGNAVSILQSGFQKIKELDGFGNARDVDAIWNAATRHRADRIVQMGMPRSKEKCFEETDISEAFSELIKGRTAADGKASLRRRDLDGPLCEPPVDLSETPPSFSYCESKIDDNSIVCKADVVAFKDIAESPSDTELNGRDSGVSDADWMELQRAKEEEDRYAEQCKAEEEERRRVEAEFAAKLRAKQLAEEAYQKKMEER